MNDDPTSRSDRLPNWLHLMWPFSRKRRHPAVSPSSETWRPGDVAECIIDDSWQTPARRRPQRGSRSIVLRVHRAARGVGLELLGYGWRWNATAFRKVVPTVEPEQSVRGLERTA